MEENKSEVGSKKSFKNHEKDDFKSESKKKSSASKTQNQNDAELVNDSQCERFLKYLRESGVDLAFQVICNEIVERKIEKDYVYGYTAMRLRQIGQDLAEIKKVVFQTVK